MATGNGGVGPATLLFGILLGVLALNGTNALPLIEEDKLALVALIQGVVPPPEGAPSRPPTWGSYLTYFGSPSARNVVISLSICRSGSQHCPA
jgi:hypothetical protein